MKFATDWGRAATEAEPSLTCKTSRSMRDFDAVVRHAACLSQEPITGLDHDATRAGRATIARARKYWRRTQRAFEDELSADTSANLRSVLHRVARRAISARLSRVAISGKQNWRLVWGRARFLRDEPTGSTA